MADPNFDSIPEVSPPEPTSESSNAISFDSIQEATPFDLIPSVEDEKRSVWSKFVPRAVSEFAEGAARELSPLVSKPLEDIGEFTGGFARELSPLVDDDVKAAAKGLGKVAYEGVEKIGDVFDISNRIGGTALGLGIHLAQAAARDMARSMAESPQLPEAARKNLDLEMETLLEKAIKREQSEKDRPGETSIWEAFRNLAPVRLTEDIMYPMAHDPVYAIGKEMQKSDQQSMRDMGEIVEGFAPVLGLANAVVGSTLADPLSHVRALSLTEKGVAAQKAGQVSPGIISQLSRGERNLLEVPILGLESTSLQTRKIPQYVFEKMANAQAKFAISKYNPLRLFQTRPVMESVARVIEDSFMARNGLKAREAEVAEATYIRAMQEGLDLTNDSQRKDFMRYLDNPSLYKEPPTSYEAVAYLLRKELKDDVDLSTAIGSIIPEKVFIERGLPGEFSERYVPRYVLPSKSKELRDKRIKIKELSKEQIEALEFVGQYEKTGDKVGVAPAAAYAKFRNARSREEMNRIFKDLFGVDEMFHDNPVLAYVNKIHDLGQDRVDVNMLLKLKDQFGTTPAELKGKIADAILRVQDAKLKGVVASADDLILSKLDPYDVLTPAGSELPYKSIERIKKLAEHNPALRGIENLQLPSFVAPNVFEALYRPEMHEVLASLHAYQQIAKQSMFFTFGFHGRNFFEAATKAHGLGVSGADEARALKAVLFRNGEWSDIYKDYLKTMNGAGMLSPFESAAETSLGRVVDAAKASAARKMAQKTLVVPEEVAKGMNSMKRGMYFMKEMAAQGKIKAFLKDLWAKVGNVRPGDEQGFKKALSVVWDNPAFRMSSAIGEAGEAIPKFAYFAKLVDSGYSAEEAARQVARHFVTYDITRQATRHWSTVIPFLNYHVKNLETAFLAIAQNPRNTVLFGPNGALERSLENWAGFDPERTELYKDIQGTGLDPIYLNIQRGHEAMMNQKDFIKDLAEKAFGNPATMTNYVRLPTSAHALRQMSPEQIVQQQSPMVKAAVHLFGYDPRLKTMSQKGEAALADLAQPLKFPYGANLTKQVIDNLYPEWRDNILNLGFTKEEVDVYFGDPESKKYRERADKALTKLRTAWMGGATRYEADETLRIIATAMDAQKALSGAIRQYANKELTSKSLEAAKEKYRQAMRDVDDAVAIGNEWNRVTSEVAKARGDGLDPEIIRALEELKKGEAELTEGGEM